MVKNKTLMLRYIYPRSGCITFTPRTESLIGIFICGTTDSM